MERIQRTKYRVVWGVRALHNLRGRSTFISANSVEIQSMMMQRKIAKAVRIEDINKEGMRNVRRTNL